MIDCKEAANKLKLYLDKEISSSDAEDLMKHLDKCSECFGHYEFDLALKKLVQKKGAEVVLPPNLKDDILKNILNENDNL